MLNVKHTIKLQLHSIIQLVYILLCRNNELDCFLNPLNLIQGQDSSQ